MDSSCRILGRNDVGVKLKQVSHTISKLSYQV